MRAVISGVLLATLAALGATACSAPKRRASTNSTASRSSRSSSSTTTAPPTTLPSSTPTLAVTPTTISPAARVGGSVFLPGVNQDPPVQVTLVKVVNPAQGADQFSVPVGSGQFVGVQLRIVFGGTSPVTLNAAGATILEDAQGNLYQPTVANILNCPAFNNNPTVRPGKPVLGCVTFDVDPAPKITEVLFTPGGQFGNVSAEWNLP
jgi:hypothetical protein